MGMCREFSIQYNGNLTIHENATASLGVYEWVGTRIGCQACLGIYLKKGSDMINYAGILGNETFDDIAKDGWWGLVRNRIFRVIFN